MFEEGVKLDPFNPDLKAGLQRASAGILQDLVDGKGRETRAITYPQSAQRITYHPYAAPLHQVRTDDMLPVKLLTPFQAENDHHIKDTYNYVTVQVGLGVVLVVVGGWVGGWGGLVPAWCARMIRGTSRPSGTSWPADTACAALKPALHHCRIASRCPSATSKAAWCFKPQYPPQRPPCPSPITPHTNPPPLLRLTSRCPSATSAC